MKDHRITINCDAAFQEAIENEAATEGQSISNECIRLCTEAMTERSRRRTKMQEALRSLEGSSK